MSALTRKLLRDTRRLAGQVLTIALVLACGVMAMVMLRSTFGSLERSRDAYYAAERFADAFARLERAPEPVAARLETIPGVARVYTRVVEEIMLPIEGEAEVVTGRIVSIPEDGPPPLNGLHLRSGRLPAPNATDEAVLLQAFADAHGLRPGDRLPAVLNGTRRELRIVGVALSPEYVFAMAGHQVAADERLFAVIWMHRDAIAPVFQMEGAFNDVAIALQPGARVTPVLEAVDRVLEPYGGVHAVARDKQLSHYALRAELENLESLAMMIPLVFLAVAAFLVNVVVSRLVYLERTQIAVLKALGYGDVRIGLHYLALVALIVAVGGAAGVALGVWSGQWMTALYTSFFKFPSDVYAVSPGLVAVTVGIAFAAAALGALGAVARVARMPPAQAMRPPTPLTYRRSVLERIGADRWLGPSAMMIVREITRRPLRFLLSTAGIAMGVGIFIMGRFSWDSFEYLFDAVYLRSNREDMSVTFIGPRPERAVRELGHLPGVHLAEGVRAVPVRFRVGHLWRDSVLVGYPPDSALHQVLDGGERVVELPAEGVIMTDKLAEILGVGVGDEVDAEIMEGQWATRRVPIAGLLDEPFGLQAYARIDWVHGLLREQPRVTSALLRIDERRGDDIRRRLRQMPSVLGSTTTDRVVANFEAQTGESVGVMTLILTLSAAAIAIGVVYNNARIALSLRSRDLASLRVLGFTRQEISAVLLGELAVQVVLGIPLGLVLGTWWAQAYAASIDPEAMRFPLHIASETYGAAALIALISGIVSALLVRRKLDELDLIAVLKASE